MRYTADGVFGAPNYEVLNDRIKRLQDHLNHANDRYHRLRQIVDFYHTLGAEDAARLSERYRRALQTIVELEPESRDFSVASLMAEAAKEALG